MSVPLYCVDLGLTTRQAIVFSKSTAAHASLFEDEKWQARALIARVDQGDWRYDEQWEDKVKVGTPPVPEWTAAPQVVGR